MAEPATGLDAGSDGRDDRGIARRRDSLRARSDALDHGRDHRGAAGASFTPEILEKAREWPLTIGCLLLYLGLLVGVLFLYFHRIVGLDPPTAYFSATPGGLSEMVITGAAMGADDRTIALIHTSRVLLVVLIIRSGTAS